MELDWKKLLNIEDTHVVGLDIGSAAVRMVQMRKEEHGYVVTAAHTANIRSAKPEDTDAQEMNTVRAIDECFRTTEVETRFAVCGVCGPEVAVRYFKFPLLPTEEIQGAVMLEAAQVCPFNIDSSAVDYQLMPNGDESICGVLVAATNKLIESKVKLAREASIDCVLMDVDGLALLNCFDEHEKGETSQTTAILNIGNSYTTLAISGPNSLPFIRDIHYAGGEIVKEIASKKGISEEEVRKNLLSENNQVAEGFDLNGTWEKACNKLIIDVNETLRYYTTQEKSSVVEKILVCGFAQVKGFIEMLNSRIPPETVLWNPFEKIPSDANQSCRETLQKNGPAMAVAAGLAMRLI